MGFENHLDSSLMSFLYCAPHTFHQGGDLDWPAFFGSLARLGFDGIMTACVFAGEDRADDSCRFMRAEIDKYVDAWKPQP